MLFLAMPLVLKFISKPELKLSNQFRLLNENHWSSEANLQFHRIYSILLYSFIDNFIL